MGKEFFCLSFFCGGGGGRMENKEHLSATREFCFEKVAEKFKKTTSSVMQHHPSMARCV